MNNGCCCCPKEHLPPAEAGERVHSSRTGQAEERCVSEDTLHTGSVVKFVIGTITGLMGFE